MEVYDLIEKLSSAAKIRSKLYQEGDVEFGFAFGWFVAEMQADLDAMKLTEEQLSILRKRIEHLTS